MIWWRLVGSERSIRARPLPLPSLRHTSAPPARLCVPLLPPLLGSSTTGKIKPASVLTSGTSPPGRPDDHRMLLVVAQTRSTHSHDLTKPHARRLQHTVTHSLPPRLRKPLPGPSAPDRQSPIPAPPILRLRQVGLVAHRPGNLIHQSSPRSLRHPHRATHPTAQSPPFLWLLPMPS